MLDDVEIVKDKDLKYRIYFTDQFNKRYGMNGLMKDLHQLPKHECEIC